MARQRRTPARQRRPAAGPRGATAVLAWEDDPGAPDSPNEPVTRPVPELNKAPLRLVIKGRKPPAKEYHPGTNGFRYWAAAEALRRAADMWAAFLPPKTNWVPSVGSQLSVRLDDGEPLDAYYDRGGLRFFHESAGGVTVYSGESPNVCCHELGHAVLDAIRPQLFHAASIEVSAFHESFGDMSSILSALQLPSVRESVLIATNGKLYRTSRLSRLGEQLGWALRQFRPDFAEADCLRNAVNSFFYQDPSTLPPAGPATQLSSEPHSFSRIFTGAFLQALAGMFALQPRSDADGLLDAANEAARLLVEAARTAPVVPSYYSQVAAHMIAADTEMFAGRYSKALMSGFVAHGILSLEAAVSIAPQPAPPGRGVAATAASAQLPRLALSAGDYGLGAELLVDAPAQPKLFVVAGARADSGSAEPQSHDRAAASFVEDLFRRGRIAIPDPGMAGPGVVNPLGRKTHELKNERGRLVLARRIFDCGFCGTALG